jgi:hypothetical protein
MRRRSDGNIGGQSQDPQLQNELSKRIEDKGFGKFW